MNKLSERDKFDLLYFIFFIISFVDYFVRDRPYLLIILAVISIYYLVVIRWEIKND